MHAISDLFLINSWHAGVKFKHAISDPEVKLQYIKDDLFAKKAAMQTGMVENAAAVSRELSYFCIEPIKTSLLLQKVSHWKKILYLSYELLTKISKAIALRTLSGSLSRISS
jgi:hypothetical protein